MSETLLVMAGGALGAALRYHSSLAVTALAGDRWPAATFAVNLTGALAMGILAGWMAARAPADGWRLLIGVGLLGGFTTFSAFSLELWSLLQAGRFWAAGAYATLSVLGSLLALMIGLFLGRSVLA